MIRLSLFISMAIALHACQSAAAHDAWLQTNTPLVRTGEVVHVDLRLGNHGNHHRDFKLAGRLNLDWVTVDHVYPDGARTDIKETMFTTASAEKEGYWTTPLIVEQPGMHGIVQKLDRVMQHGKSVRSIRTAKTYFLVADSLDQPSLGEPIHATPLGLPFELVLQTCPLSEVVVGQPITVQALHHGQPIADVTICFIPEGTELAGEFDPEYEFRTGAEGKASFVPKTANRYLVAAHHSANDERGEDYESTSYASTITLHVPRQRSVVVSD